MQETQICRPASSATSPAAPQYVPPRIESVMKPDDLAREVQYAGAPDGSLPVG